MLGHIFKVYGADSFKPGYDPVTGLIMSGIGAVGSLGSSLIGGSSQIDAVNATNRANLQATRETNEQNYKMFHEAQDFTESMWNKTNQYNSPVEQVQRLRDAGINPFAVLGSNGQGTLGSAGIVSSPTPTPMQAPHFQAPDYSPMIEGISRSIDSFFSNLNQGEDAELKKVDLAFKALEKRQDLRNKRAEYEEILSRKGVNESTRKKILKEIDSLDREQTLFDTVFDSTVKRYHLDNLVADQEYRMKSEQVRKQQLDNKMQEMVNDAFPKLNAYQMQVLAGQASQAFASAGLSREMTNTEKQKTIGQVLKNGIDAGLFTLQQLGMNQAELDSILAGKKLSAAKSSTWSKVTAALQMLDAVSPSIKIRP